MFEQPEDRLAAFQVAWKTSDSFRADVIDDIVRFVGKTGRLLGSNSLNFLVTANLLTDVDVLNLFRYISERSLRQESEWRTEFDTFFPQYQSKLPPPNMGGRMPNFSLSQFIVARIPFW